VKDLSVAEAASALGVDDSRVRQMLRAGTLDGRHVGRSWVVSADSVSSVQANPSRVGRPFAPQRAWAVLDLLDGGQGDWLPRVARSQVRAQLRSLVGADAATWRSVLRARESRRPVKGHSAALSRLAGTKGVWLVGPSAASSAGADLIAPGARPEFYISDERWPALAHSLHLSEADSGPDAFVRIPKGLWPFGPAGPGRAALAASLLDSGEWRAAKAGADVLNELAERLAG
jgi:excisionase family DNA binding protein